MKIYVVEDNFVHRAFLRDRVKHILKTEKISGEVLPLEDLKHLIPSLNKMRIDEGDLFLIDIDLNLDYDGIDLAKLIRKKNRDSFIIFVTSDSTKSLEIVNNQITPFAYIIKEDNLIYSVDDELKRVIQQVQMKIENQNAQNYIVVSRSGKEVIRLEHLNYLETVGGNRFLTKLNYKREERFINKKLSELRKELPANFFKEFRSYIINLNNISSINRTIGIVYFKNGEFLELSPRMIDKLRKKV
ncbi:LytR/AlgR family response regulator transcription factor [Listeria aquatica]|uniref:LytR/AlgR family response regulator transcription factor n=1 Tax=Listeria aquatica TaxID=1494960 RepID=UPI003EF277D5